MKVCIFKYYKYNNLTVFLALAAPTAASGHHYSATAAKCLGPASCRRATASARPNSTCTAASSETAAACTAPTTCSETSTACTAPTAACAAPTTCSETSSRSA